MKSVLFYMVKWCQYSGNVDYQYTISCALLFQCCLPKIINIRSNLLKLLTKTLLAFFTLDTIKRHFRWRHNYVSST